MVPTVLVDLAIELNLRIYIQQRECQINATMKFRKLRSSLPVKKVVRR